MEINELGARLRTRRQAAGRTIASVAADAGLSVPYIANLENGRGNPTLTAVNSLAAALGVRLTVQLDQPGTPLPPGLLEFAGAAAFARVTGDLVRADVLAAMAALGALAGRDLTATDWQRILDTLHLLRTAA
ncbi:helix-turn-helix domain-containing protein [Hamadaea tsunoensis]|uniref:helix-turn-helix domain-containing protein n=1 Tax=Hamadaea tsunoensis TaxID=53368 RepID=UPI0003F81813|nr:helix-turn-helix transcriptional regulator [Hamadaea tsunoensis]